MIRVDFDTKVITVDNEADKLTVLGWHKQTIPEVEAPFVKLDGAYRIEFDHGDHRSTIAGASWANTVHYAGAGGIPEAAFGGGGGGTYDVTFFPEGAIGGAGHRCSDFTIPPCPVCGASGGGGHGGGCPNIGKPSSALVVTDQQKDPK